MAAQASQEGGEDVPDVHEAQHLAVGHYRCRQDAVLRQDLPACRLHIAWWQLGRFACKTGVFVTSECSQTAGQLLQAVMACLGVWQVCMMHSNHRCIHKDDKGACTVRNTLT